MLVSYIYFVFLLTVWSAEATTKAAVKKLKGGVVGTEAKCQADEKYIYCVDNSLQKIYQISIKTNKVVSTDTQCESPTFIIPVNDAVIVFFGRLIYVYPQGIFGADEKSIFITSLDDWKPNNYIASGIFDGLGFLWCVTDSLAGGTRSVYRIKEKVTEVIIRSFVYLNVIAFSTDYKNVYFVDSNKGIIYICDVNLADGGISNQRVFFVIAKLAVKIVGKVNYIVSDNKGNIYLAVGNTIVIISRFGKYVSSIELSAEVIISLAFGGDNLADLYASCKTTAGGGAIFIITGLSGSGIKGKPDFGNKLGIN